MLQLWAPPPWKYATLRALGCQLLAIIKTGTKHTHKHTGQKKWTWQNHVGFLYMCFDTKRGLVVITRVRQQGGCGGVEELFKPSFENKRSEEVLEDIQVEAHCYII